MAAKKRGLGRGLDALLGSAGAPAEHPAPAETKPQDLTDLREIPVDLIRRGIVEDSRNRVD